MNVNITTIATVPASISFNTNAFWFKTVTFCFFQRINVMIHNSTATINTPTPNTPIATDVAVILFYVVDFYKFTIYIFEDVLITNIKDVWI